MSQIHPLTALTAYRKRAQLTKAELARLLGVSKATISRWENGDRRVDDELLSRVAKKTGIAALELRPDLKVKLGIA